MVEKSRDPGPVGITSLEPQGSLGKVSILCKFNFASPVLVKVKFSNWLEI